MYFLDHSGITLLRDSLIAVIEIPVVEGIPHR